MRAGGSRGLQFVPHQHSYINNYLLSSDENLRTIAQTTQPLQWIRGRRGERNFFRMTLRGRSHRCSEMTEVRSGQSFDSAIVRSPPAACLVGGRGPAVARWLRDGPQCWVRIRSVALSPD
uniref:Uncharacterized protein n=1 Tax=Ralstonia syzygii R24 TaxID=907261 RepID=G3ABW5_9RALS|nr:hypothetical protein RALSY_mp30346 [Ralstonia syzygii R24]